MRVTKTGSSRRKGDEYQDLKALQFSLELYASKSDFELFIEYEKAGSLDDVCVVQPSKVTAVQVKHAVNDNSVYTLNDFVNEDSPVYLKKFTDSWEKICTDFPSKDIELRLCSNKSLNADIADLLESTGGFNQPFRENRYRKTKRQLRQSLLSASGLSECDFRAFISVFRFDLKQPTYLKLEHVIQADLLDHKLGISDNRVLLELKRLIEHHAIESTAPITPNILDDFFKRVQTRYLLPQSFSVDETKYVKRDKFSQELNSMINQASGEYIVVTGPPGSGKSTTLTKHFDDLAEREPGTFRVARYYCFVRPNENLQKLRLEAKSLRVNFLTELRKLFPDVLKDRQFDYSDVIFFESLELIGKHCVEKGEKLILFLDGLDHADRDKSVRDNVIEALPRKLPENVVFVIGSQELSSWKPLTLEQARKVNHLPIPLFTIGETLEYLNNRCGVHINQRAAQAIFKKSSGLPLYLHYVGQALSNSENHDVVVNSLSKAVNGDICTYYDSLWLEMESDGLAEARHFSLMLAALRFPIDMDEIILFQSDITSQVTVTEAYRWVKHLLKVSSSQISIFHDSFRAFLLAKISEQSRRKISLGILAHLKKEEGESNRWFQYAFDYALEAKDYSYILKNVNREYVDRSLIQFRSTGEIESAIDIAIHAAKYIKDIPSLSRLATLKFRTYERLEDSLSWSLLNEILLLNSKPEAVISSIYSEQTDEFIEGKEHILRTILMLDAHGYNAAAFKLFDRHLKNFKNERIEEDSDLEALSECFGRFQISPKKVVNWLSEYSFQFDILKPKEYAEKYAPHLESYLRGLAQSQQKTLLRRISRITSPFSNKLIKHLAIRVSVDCCSKSETAFLLREYLAAYPDEVNLELAFFAANVNLPHNEVNGLAGTFEFPLVSTSERFTLGDLIGQLQSSLYWATIFSYENNSEVLRQIRVRYSPANNTWKLVQLHIINTGILLGRHLANANIDWYVEACSALDFIVKICEVEGERTWEVLSALRGTLNNSLYQLSNIIVERCPSRISEWVGSLINLRKSFAWTTHYGIGSAETDYSFEFSILRKLMDLRPLRPHLNAILQDCANTYNEALSLKGSTRGDHFLNLAAIAAKCSFKTDAKIWLNHGIKASLTYGYRKDTTLNILTDVLEEVAKQNPKVVLPSASRILKLIKLVPYATDGRGTKHFAQHLFPIVMKQSRSAALELLRVYYNEFATWKADQALEKYILNREDGDPDFLWALCGLLDPNNCLPARTSVSKLARKSSANSVNDVNNRLFTYIKTMVNLRRWPEDFASEMPVSNASEPLSTSGRLSQNEPKYVLGSDKLTINELKTLCGSSLKVMIETVNRLKQQNNHIPDYELLSGLHQHIESASDDYELNTLSEFCDANVSSHEYEYSKALAEKYLLLGSSELALTHFEKAYMTSPQRELIEPIVRYDEERARELLLKTAFDKISGPSYQCFDAPKFIGAACEALGLHSELDSIFCQFLNDCEELFTNFPISETPFNGLSSWSKGERDERTQITHLLIDRLGDEVIESGHRLLCSIEPLASQCHEVFLPVLFERLDSAAGLRKWRIKLLLSRLSFTNAAALLPYSENIIRQIGSSDVHTKLLMLEIAQRIWPDEEQPFEIAEAIAKAQELMSPVITSNPSIIEISPSDEFIELIKRGALFEFRRQVVAVSEILDLEINSVLAALERKFVALGKTVDSEMETVRDMGRKYSHAQGWPIIWFCSEFHVQVSNLLYEFIEKVISQKNYPETTLRSLWRAIQHSDPEYSILEELPKPVDIPRLPAMPPNEWFDICKADEVIVMYDSFPSDWVTAFEFREMAHDSEHHVEYRTQSHIRTALVSQSALSNINYLTNANWDVPVQIGHDKENLTWEQFRKAVVGMQPTKRISNTVFCPFTASKNKSKGFIGFHALCSLAPSIIQEAELRFKGSSIYSDETLVAFFEPWREGTPVNDYESGYLNFGVRLRVSTEFVQKMCQQTGKKFVSQEIEQHVLLEKYKPEFKQSSLTKKFRIWGL